MIESNVWQIVSLSLRVAGIAIIVALPAAFIVAWILARFNFPGKSLAQAIVTMPLVLPPVVTGYLLLILLGRVERWARLCRNGSAFPFFSLDGRGPCCRCYGVSAARSSDQAFDRRA